MCMCACVCVSVFACAATGTFRKMKPTDSTNYDCVNCERECEPEH